MKHLTIVDTKAKNPTSGSFEDGLWGGIGINGRGIVSIQKTGTSGSQDTYTITYTDNTTSTYTVNNGEQADWNQTDDTAPDYIKNKPTIPTFGTAATKDMDDELDSTSTNPVENRAIYSEISGIEQDIELLKTKVNTELYGIKIDKNDSNPATRVSYMYDAVGKTPAHMNFTTGEFDYGGWEDAWFIKGNQPGIFTLGNYVSDIILPAGWSTPYPFLLLNKNDQRYTIWGSLASNLEPFAYVSMIPTVWIKRWEDENFEYIAFSNEKISKDFHACAHFNRHSALDPSGAGVGEDEELEKKLTAPYIFLPMYMGGTYSSNGDTYYAPFSLPNLQLNSMSGKTISFPGEEQDAAFVPSSLEEAWWRISEHDFVVNWETVTPNERGYVQNSCEHPITWMEHELITDLLFLISKTTDAQSAFGKGMVDSSSASVAERTTGYTIQNGQFYGTDANRTTPVKVFYLENFWHVTLHSGYLLSGVGASYDVWEDDEGNESEYFAYFVVPGSRGLTPAFITGDFTGQVMPHDSSGTSLQGTPTKYSVGVYGSLPLEIEPSNFLYRADCVQTLTSDNVFNLQCLAGYAFMGDATGPSSYNFTTEYGSLPKANLIFSYICNME